MININVSRGILSDEDLSKIKIISPYAIGLYFCEIIKNTSEINQLIFHSYEDCDYGSFDEINKDLKNGVFSLKKLTDKEIEIIKHKGIFTPQEVENWLNKKVNADSLKSKLIKVYYNDIQKLIKK